MKPFKGVVVQQNFEIIEKTEVAAFILRQEIQNIKQNKLPDQLNTTDLIGGECDIPDSLLLFT